MAAYFVKGLDTNSKCLDVWLNNRVLHVIPPYRHLKQRDHLELLKAYFVPDQDKSSFARIIDMMRAAGGTEEEATWLYNAEDEAAVRRAIEEHQLQAMFGEDYLVYMRSVPRWIGRL